MSANVIGILLGAFFVLGGFRLFILQQQMISEINGVSKEYQIGPFARFFWTPWMTINLHLRECPDNRLRRLYLKTVLAMLAVAILVAIAIVVINTR